MVYIERKWPSHSFSKPTIGGSIRFSILCIMEFKPKTNAKVVKHFQLHEINILKNWCYYTKL